MTKKHSEAIAKIFNNARDKYRLSGEALQYHKYILEDFADMMEGETPNFDRDRFFAACGLES